MLRQRRGTREIYMNAYQDHMFIHALPQGEGGTLIFSSYVTSTVYIKKYLEYQAYPQKYLKF